MDSSSIFHEFAHILLQCTNKDILSLSETSAVTQRRASFIDGYWPFSIFLPYHVPSSLLPFFVTHSPCQHPGTLQTLAASLWLFFLIFSGVLPWRVIFRLLLLLSLMMQLRIVACTSLNEPLMKSEWGVTFFTEEIDLLFLEFFIKCLIPVSVWFIVSV